MTKAFSRDFAPSRGTDLHTVEKIGNTRERLPDGSLLCRDVPIARTGEMGYDPSELIDEEGNEVCISPNGRVSVIRGDEQLFNEQTIRSFEGVSVTIGHPPVQVTPQNYRTYARGFVRNVRRGEGALADHLVADLVVRDNQAIDLVESDKAREVSPGYDANYDPVENKPGVYTQTGIVGNHLAIVERGRGGRTVRIGDSARGMKMAFKKNGWGARILKGITTGDSDEIEQAIRDGAQEAPDTITIKPTTDEDPMAQCMAAITSLSEKLDALPAAIAAALKPATTDEDQGEEKPSETKDEDEDEGEEKPSETTDEDDDEKAEEYTTDEASMVSEEGKTLTGDAAFGFVRKHTISVAEVLSPGLKSGTLDSATSLAGKRKSINGFRRAALENALSDPSKNAIVGPIVGRRGVRALTSDSLFRAFVAAGDAVSKSNNNRSAGQNMTFTSDAAGITTVQQMQERNRAFWSGK